VPTEQLSASVRQLEAYAFLLFAEPHGKLRSEAAHILVLLSHAAFAASNASWPPEADGSSRLQRSEAFLPSTAPVGEVLARALPSVVERALSDDPMQIELWGGKAAVDLVSPALYTVHCVMPENAQRTILFAVPGRRRCPSEHCRATNLQQTSSCCGKALSSIVRRGSWSLRRRGADLAVLRSGHGPCAFVCRRRERRYSRRVMAMARATLSAICHIELSAADMASRGKHGLYSSFTGPDDS
jgi:hypothetical protein